MERFQKLILSSGWVIAVFLAGYVWAGSSETEVVLTTSSTVQADAEEYGAKDESPQIDAPVSGVQRQAANHNYEKLSFGNGYQQFLVSEFYGQPAPLKIRSDQRIFETRIMKAYQSPINFGGSLVIMRFGCGTGCSFAYALDKSSGLVLDFPIGGEVYQALQIHARVDSALVWASWYDDPSWERCRAQAWRLGASGFSEVSPEVSISCASKDQVPSI